MHPHSVGSFVWLGIAELSEGRSEEAIRLFREALRISPGFLWAYGNLGFVYGKLGRRPEAHAVIVEISQLRNDRAIEYNLAGVYAGLGDRGSAFEQLESAYKRRAVELIWLNVDHRFKDLHGDSRFTALLKRMKLE